MEQNRYVKYIAWKIPKVKKGKNKKKRKEKGNEMEEGSVVRLLTEINAWKSLY